jgi:hypothetical protein
VTDPQSALDPALVDALNSARRIVTADPRDWSANRHDAFLYGVFCGWDDPAAEAEVAARHSWDEQFVARLHRLRDAVDRALG